MKPETECPADYYPAHPNVTLIIDEIQPLSLNHDGISPVTEPSEVPTLRQRVLDLVNNPQYRPTKPKDIHRILKLSEDDYRPLRKLIKRMVLDREIAFASNHMVVPVVINAVKPAKTKSKRSFTRPAPPEPTDLPTSTPSLTPSSSSHRTANLDGQLTSQADKSSSKTLSGKYRQAAAGFGFVRPAAGSDPKYTEDIFIPSDSTGGAMDSDIVCVRLRTGRRGGGQDGEVIEIIQRARRQFSGSYDVRDGKSIVHLDGVTVGSPVEVGDVRGLPVEPGDKVVVELVKFPDGAQVGEGVIMEVLGSSKNPAVDTLAVMHQYGLIEKFPDEVIEQARAQADAFVEGAIPADRRDLTKVPTLTIDPADARDFDDAISLSRNEKGNWELMVHIADVAHFVPVGTPLDAEAKRRATSVYLPDRVIPCCLN